MVFSPKIYYEMNNNLEEHLNDLHYINDILQLNIDDINADFEENFFIELFPLYLNFLKPNYFKKSLLSSALFLLSHIFSTITYEPWLERFSCILFHGDFSILKKNKIKRLDNYVCVIKNICDKDNQYEYKRDFFDIILLSLNCEKNDFVSLLTLCFLNACFENKCKFKFYCVNWMLFYRLIYK